MKELYGQVIKERWERLNELIQENCNLQGYTHLSFAYNGEFYSLVTTDGPPVRNRVHPDLIPQVKQFVDYYDRQILGEEKTKISGFFDSVLSLSKWPADWLAVLPYCMQTALHKSVTTGDWVTHVLSVNEHQAFIEKHKPRYDLVKQRMAMNLIT